MPSNYKYVGDAWGRLFAVAVDACKSHHESHCDDGASAVGRRLDDDSEISSIAVTVSQRCEASWTGTKGQVKVAVDAPNGMAPSPTAMYLLDAGAVMSTASTPGAATPTPIPPGVSQVVISMNPLPARGLYVGRLRATISAGPNQPILIYVDDVF